MLRHETARKILKAKSSFYHSRGMQRKETVSPKNDSTAPGRIDSDVHISRLNESAEILPTRLILFSFRCFDSGSKKWTNPLADNELHNFSVLAIISSHRFRKVLTDKTTKIDLECFPILM